MEDLNDLQLYAAVVEQGSFSAAGRALGVPKSRLSRRIALLERRLGVRLIQRSTRKLRVTDLGQAYFERCRAMLAEAQAARELVEQARLQPRGTLRVSCPIGLVPALSGPLARFMRDNPEINLILDATNRRVDVIGEGYDVAIRVRSVVEDSALGIRLLREAPSVLAASPALLERLGRPDTPQALARQPGVGFPPTDGLHVWLLRGPGGEEARITYAPRLVTEDFTVLRAAAMAGIGLGVLPRQFCEDALASGALVEVLPGWLPPSGRLHAVFPSPRGLVPAVRAFIDFLVAEQFALPA